MRHEKLKEAPDARARKRAASPLGESMHDVPGHLRESGGADILDRGNRAAAATTRPAIACVSTRRSFG